jgi:hypothetical protein
MVMPVKQGIKFKLPDGTFMTSTHTAHFPIQGLPREATLAHIFPNLDSSSLLSVGQICDYGCTATFTKHAVAITSRGVTIITGNHSSATVGLWTMDPCQSNMPVDTPQSNTIVGSVGSVSSDLNHDTIANQVVFYHANLFSPALSTWCETIDAGHFTTWPGLTSAQVRKFLPQSAATHKGHLDQQGSNQCSTRAPPPAVTKNQEPDVKTRQQLEDTRVDACPSEPPSAQSHCMYVK